jgi:ABC-2 type transport system permease protein
MGAAVAPAPACGVLRASAVMVGRSARLAGRDVESLLMAVVLPVMLMLVFTYVFGGALSPSGSTAAYLDYVVPGVVLTCAGFGAGTTAVAVNRDLAAGTVARLRTMPVPSASLLVGHVVVSLVRNLVATAVVLVVAVLIGYRPDAGSLAWLGVAGVLAAWILALTAVFAWCGLVAGSPEAASGYGFVLLFLPYASSAFVPVETMPGWLSSFAAHQPVTPVVETLRDLLAGQTPGFDALVALVWCGCLTASALGAAAYLFPRRGA